LLSFRTFLASLLGVLILVCRHDVHQIGLHNLDLLSFEMRECGELQMSAVGALLAHVPHVCIKWFRIIDKASVLVRVSLQIVAYCMSDVCMLVRITVQLIGQRPEQTVSVAQSVRSIQAHGLQLGRELLLGLLWVFQPIL